MEKTIGFRFHPTDDEMVDNFLRRKNLEIDTSDVDKDISTVDLYSFDPWELPSQSKIKSNDQAWYFYCRKENKYNRGDRQNRKTKSGFWKKTGHTKDVMRKRGNREKIGEKRILVFQFSKDKKGFGSKTGWTMHEYHATLSSPNQMMTYTICKIKFKGESKEINCYSGGQIQSIHSLIPQTNQSGGLSTGSEEPPFNSQESQNPSQSNGCLVDEQQEAQLQDALNRGFDNLSSDDWNYVFNVDEQSMNVNMQENFSHYRPPKPLSGVFDDHSSDDDDDDVDVDVDADVDVVDDDDDDDLISATTKSIQTSSTCDSFASSNHGIDQIKTLQSPELSIKSLSLTQEVSGQGTEIGEHKSGQEVGKKKKAAFYNRMIQGIIRKFQLCSSISKHDIKK